jgi:hypothetical protein
MLLNEAQKQYERSEGQAAVIATQRQKIEELEKRLSRLEALVGAQVTTVRGLSTDIHGNKGVQ